MMLVPLDLRVLSFGRGRVERLSRPCSLSEEEAVEEEGWESGFGIGIGEDWGSLGAAMKGSGWGVVEGSSVIEAMIAWLRTLVIWRRWKRVGE